MFKISVPISFSQLSFRKIPSYYRLSLFVTVLVASWNITVGLLNAKFYPDPFVLILPIGLGLIKQQLWAQWWARFCIILGYIFCSVFAAIAISSPKNGAFTFGWFDRSFSFTGYEGTVYLVVVIVLLLAILGVMHKLLYSEKAKDYFHLGYVNLDRIKLESKLN